jgi:hypothetical protein
MFLIEGFFNPYLAAGQTRLDAVLTIRSDASAAASAPAGKQVVGFVMDVSGSMSGDKLAQAKLAARRGIDLLEASTWFFVVVFSGAAKVLVSACPATPQNKAAAHQAVQELKASGSTAMSRGLDLALREVQRCDAGIASVYFQTDGDNGADDSALLAGVLERCKGVFQCDCRGIGTAWKPSELRMIAGALMGTADAVTDPAGLEEDFRAFLSRSLAKGIAGATLRLWSPKVVKLLTAKQVSPEIVDQLPLSRRIDDKTLEIPLGAWASETRDYQLAFELPAGAIGDEILACRASVIFDGPQGETRVGCDPVAVKWTTDDLLTTRISKEVAHYNGQGELATSIQEGLEARAQGDEDKATRLLGRAAQIAEETGNDEVTRRLRKVVDVVDAAAGTVRLRKSDKAAEMALEMGGTRTVRRRAAPAAQS